MQIPMCLDEPSNEREQLLRQDEVAKILDVSPRTLEAWRHRGGGYASRDTITVTVGRKFSSMSAVRIQPIAGRARSA